MQITTVAHQLAFEGGLADLPVWADAGEAGH